MFEGEELLKVYYNTKEIKIDDLVDCFEIVEAPISKPNIILEVVE